MDICLRLRLRIPAIWVVAMECTRDEIGGRLFKLDWCWEAVTLQGHVRGAWHLSTSHLNARLRERLQEHWKGARCGGAVTALKHGLGRFPKATHNMDVVDDNAASYVWMVQDATTLWLHGVGDHTNCEGFVRHVGLASW